MTVSNLPRCSECKSVVRYRRRTNDYACSYCPKIFTVEEARELPLKVQIPREAVKTFDIQDVRIFNQPTMQAPQAATATTQENTYSLRSEK